MKSEAGASFQRPPEFDYPAREYALVWLMTKGGNVARCALWTHPFGAELRISIGDDLFRSHASRDVNALIDMSAEWRRQFHGKGWTVMDPCWRAVRTSVPQMETISKAFEAEWRATDFRHGVAIFHTTEAGYDGLFIVYFTPDAAEIVDAIRAHGVLRGLTVDDLGGPPLKHAVCYCAGDQGAAEQLAR